MDEQEIKLIFAENLVYYLDANGKTQADLYKYMGVSSAIVSNWCTGTKMPRADKIQIIANWLNIEIGDLLKKRHDGERKPQSIKAVRIPVLGKVIAGIPIDAIEEILDYEEITSEMAMTGEFFCLQIKGNSMEPRFVEGDVVVVRQQSDAESGDIVIAFIGNEETTVKKLIKYDDTQNIALVSLNPAYPPIHFSKEQIAKMPVAIIGKVVELRGKF